jgi:hypothetical protein
LFQGLQRDGEPPADLRRGSQSARLPREHTPAPGSGHEQDLRGDPPADGGHGRPLLGLPGPQSPPARPDEAPRPPELRGLGHESDQGRGAQRHRHAARLPAEAEGRARAGRGPQHLLLAALALQHLRSDPGRREEPPGQHRLAQPHELRLASRVYGSGLDTPLPHRPSFPSHLYFPPLLPSFTSLLYFPAFLSPRAASPTYFSIT